MALPNVTVRNVMLNRFEDSSVLIAITTLSSEIDSNTQPVILEEPSLVLEAQLSNRRSPEHEGRFFQNDNEEGHARFNIVVLVKPSTTS